MSLIFLVSFAIGLAFACVSTAVEPKKDDAVKVAIGDATAVFRKISPQKYKLKYPEFYMLESEVTNRMYREYLRATKRTKDDETVVAEVRRRNAEGGVTTASTPYSVDDESMVWSKEKYPKGLDEHPVGLVTLKDATQFCKWLTKTHPKKGLFRLPTWNEWMIAAYGDRNYPWGEKWNSELAHTSYGFESDKRQRRTEPVKARPRGRTPEGLFGMIGNVSEYIIEEDPTGRGYFNLGARWMGGGFEDGVIWTPDYPKEMPAREDYWGYSHSPAPREDHLGFRVVLDPKKNDKLVERPRLFPQRNRSWQTEEE